ncbi:inositol polyphosphate 5-phosphatase [Aureococcus anophagefferens]|uniref:Inositol polyphosphate 5-phosphatase n=1 Tax=Aureococcus anophagefferens TaxID=44056 RepID=A0ABR1FMH8_AURAN
MGEPSILDAALESPARAEVTSERNLALPALTISARELDALRSLRASSEGAAVPVEWVVDVADNNLNWFIATAYSFDDAASTVRVAIPDREEPDWEGDLPLDHRTIHLIECCDDASAALYKHVVAAATVPVAWRVEWALDGDDDRPAAGAAGTARYYGRLSNVVYVGDGDEALQEVGVDENLKLVEVLGDDGGHGDFEQLVVEGIVRWEGPGDDGREDPALAVAKKPRKALEESLEGLERLAGDMSRCMEDALRMRCTSEAGQQKGDSTSLQHPARYLRATAKNRAKMQGNLFGDDKKAGDESAKARRRELEGAVADMLASAALARAARARARRDHVEDGLRARPPPRTPSSAAKDESRRETAAAPQQARARDAAPPDAAVLDAALPLLDGAGDDVQRLNGFDVVAVAFQGAALDDPVDASDAASRQAVAEAVKTGDWASLVGGDASSARWRSGAAGWETATPRFPPTAFLEAFDGEAYGSGAGVAPAWCERVLWKSLPGLRGSLGSSSTTRGAAPRRPRRRRRGLLRVGAGAAAGPPRAPLAVSFPVLRATVLLERAETLDDARDAAAALGPCYLEISGGAARRAGNGGGPRSCTSPRNFVEDAESLEPPPDPSARALWDDDDALLAKLEASVDPDDDGDHVLFKVLGRDDGALVGGALLGGRSLAKRLLQADRDAVDFEEPILLNGVLKGFLRGSAKVARDGNDGDAQTPDRGAGAPGAAAPAPETATPKGKSSMKSVAKGIGNMLGIRKKK